MNQKLAVFDVDGTLIRENIGITYVKFLLREKQVKPISYLVTVILYSLYKLRIIDFKWAIIIGAWALRGNERKSLERLAAECAHKIIRRNISQAGINEIASLKSQGWRVIIATGAHELIAKEFASLVGVDDFIATQSDFCNGIATFKMAKPLPYREGKANLVVDYAKRNGIEEIGRVYTDEQKDIPLLKVATVPIGVNADEQVKAYVLQHNEGVLMTFELP